MVLIGFSLPPRPRKKCECVGKGVSAHLTKNNDSLCHACEAVECILDKISRRKRSLDGNPLADQGARNFVAFEVQSL